MVLQDAPPQVGITQTQLSSMIEGALSSALDTRFGSSGAAQDPNAATLALEPSNSSLRALHRWTLGDDVQPPTEGQVILLNQDGVEILDGSEFERRYAAMGQPAIAGFVDQLDGVGGLDIPWGSILLGALPGAIVSEVVDGLVAPRNTDGSINFQNLGSKMLIAWAGVQFGGQFIGRRASQFFAGGLLLFVLADFLPIDQWVANMIGFFNRDGAMGQNTRVREHELSLLNQQSEASRLDPSTGTDALETLRALKARQGAA